MSAQEQQQRRKKKKKNLHDKHKERRKHDCMIFLPFIVAYQGDPAQNFYCNDIRDGHNNATYELIRHEGPFVRLKRYMKHHVLNISKKVLIWKAG
jgi:hypothetical protein